MNPDEQAKQILLNPFDIKTEGQLVRQSMDDDHITELASSIAQMGLLQPIVVGQRPNGKYYLIAGAHRLAAVKRLRWKAIPANLHKLGADEPVKGAAIIENVIRKQMTLEDEVAAVVDLHDRQGYSPSQICALTGRGRAWVDRRLAIPHLPESITEALMEGQISLNAAEIISRVTHEGMREAILNEAIYLKRTLREIRLMVEAAESADNIGEAVEAGIKQKEAQAEVKALGRLCDCCQEAKDPRSMTMLWICRACKEQEIAAEPIPE